MISHIFPCGPIVSQCLSSCLSLNSAKATRTIEGDVFPVGVTMFVKEFVSPENKCPRDRCRVIRQHDGRHRTQHELIEPSFHRRLEKTCGSKRRKRGFVSAESDSLSREAATHPCRRVVPVGETQTDLNVDYLVAPSSSGTNSRP